jgi:hypothetical protein
VQCCSGLVSDIVIYREMFHPPDDASEYLLLRCNIHLSILYVIYKSKYVSVTNSAMFHIPILFDFDSECMLHLSGKYISIYYRWEYVSSVWSVSYIEGV